MRLPITEQAMEDAKEYAMKAGDYTYLHDGFKDTSETQQYNRWLTGGFAQNIIKEYCKINNIQVEEDGSSYKENDKYDLKIKGFSFDVKATNSNIPCQVNNTSLMKATKGITHCFFFVKIDKNFKWYDPIGFTTSKYYSENCTIVKKGDIIPGTRFTNKFNTTYVMNNDLIQYEGIDSLMWLKAKDF